MSRHKEKFDCAELVANLRFRGWSEKNLQILNDVLWDRAWELMRHSVNGHFYSDKRSNPLTESGLLRRVPQKMLEPLQQFLCAAYQNGITQAAFDALRERVKLAISNREWRDRKKEVGVA